MKFNYKVIFTNSSIRELEEIFDYISNKLYAPKTAKDLIRKIYDSISNLKYMPKSGKIIKKYPELVLEYRKLSVKNYSVIYTINETENKVYIVHLYHGKRDYLNLF